MCIITESMWEYKWKLWFCYQGRKTSPRTSPGCVERRQTSGGEINELLLINIHCDLTDPSHELYSLTSQRQNVCWVHYRAEGTQRETTVSFFFISRKSISWRNAWFTVFRFSPTLVEKQMRFHSSGIEVDNFFESWILNSVFFMSFGIMWIKLTVSVTICVLS